MFGAEKGSAINLDGSALAIGIVQARFNESITDSLAQACLQELAAMGVQLKDAKDPKTGEITTSWEVVS